MANTDQVSASADTNDRGVDTSSSVLLTSPSGTAARSGGFAMGRATMCSNGSPPLSLAEPLAAERYRWEIEEVCRCIRSGEIQSRLVPHPLTVQAMQIIDRARIAANLDPST